MKVGQIEWGRDSAQSAENCEAEEGRQEEEEGRRESNKRGKVRKRKRVTEDTQSIDASPYIK